MKFKKNFYKKLKILEIKIKMTIVSIFIRSTDNNNRNTPTPKARACPIPNLGTFLAHNGLKWSVRQILPPLQKSSDFIKL